MITSRVLLACLLLLITAGSIRASDRAGDASPTHKKNSRDSDSQSAGGGFVLQGTLTPCETQALGGGGIHLSGGLIIVADSCDGARAADESECSVAIDEAPPRKGSRFDRMAALLAQWGMCGQTAICEFDLDGDEIVGPADLRLLFKEW